MRKCIVLSACVLSMSTAALAQPMARDHSRLLTKVPESSFTVTDWYKQDVYDPQNNNIGQIKDVLVAKDGRVEAAIVGVGGFLGAGQKDVAVSFDAVKQSIKDDKVHLTMDTSKDALKRAPGFKYDSNKTTWVPDTPNNDDRSR
jgi:sporulation protein YlmC with PRC-barrel domain